MVLLNGVVRSLESSASIQSGSSHAALSEVGNVLGFFKAAEAKWTTLSRQGLPQVREPGTVAMIPADSSDGVTECGAWTVA